VKKEILLKVIAVLAALTLWQIASMAVGMEMLLASPIQVIQKLFTIWFEDGFIGTLVYSSLRTLLGFTSGLVLGLILAVIASKIKVIEIMLWPYMKTIMAVPIASFIILCLIWFSYEQLTVLITFLIAFPVFYANILHGIQNTDGKMTEMATLYGVKWNKKLLYIYSPSIKKALISATGIAMGMAWKAGVAAEVIGVVKGSIGEKLYNAKVYFLNADLLAWTVIIIVLSILFEKAFSLILKVIFDGVEKL